MTYYPIWVIILIENENKLKEDKIMIGIYKITNKINQKCYIGQSIHIEKRWKEHVDLAPTGETLLYKAFRKYGIENFIFEIIEECQANQLGAKEKYWSTYYNSLTPNGYNMVECGDQSFGEYNQNSKFSTEEIYTIRKRVYIDLESPSDVLESLANIDRTYFYKILHGDFRKEEGSGIELVHSLHSVGEANSRTSLTNQEVLLIRTRVHIDHIPQLTVFQDYKDRISWQAFIKLVSGETWQNVDCSMIKPLTVERAGKPKAKITKAEVGYIRYRYETLGHSVSDIFKDFDDRVTRKTISRIVNYETWKDVKPVSTIPEA